MNLSSFFTPFKPPTDLHFPLRSLGARLSSEVNKELLPNAEVALLGVSEERGTAGNLGCAKGPDVIREAVYALQDHFNFNLIDLGNLALGGTLADSQKALQLVLNELQSREIVPIILGGSQDLTFPQYLSLASKQQKVDVLAIDSHFDLAETASLNYATSNGWLKNIIEHEPDFLFNYSHLGYQRCFASDPVLRLMEKLCFDTYRLGELFQNIEDTEPVIRSAHMVSFDISALRFSDAPARCNQNPHGFYGEDACQMMRYAGMGASVYSVGFYEFNPDYDVQNQTAQLIAQMIWYFLDGFAVRKKETTPAVSRNYYKYRTWVGSEPLELVFFKSKKTARWWMQVPYPAPAAKNQTAHLVACSYEDFKLASNGEIPDLWWKTVQKL